MTNGVIDDSTGDGSGQGCCFLMFVGLLFWAAGAVIICWLS